MKLRWYKAKPSPLVFFQLTTGVSSSWLALVETPSLKVIRTLFWVKSFAKVVSPRRVTFPLRVMDICSSYVPAKM